MFRKYKRERWNHQDCRSQIKTLFVSDISRSDEADRIYMKQVSVA